MIRTEAVVRNGFIAFFMISTIAACAADVRESTQDDFDWPSLPSGAWEDRCYEAYLNDIAECKRLPREGRQPCYAQASVKHGECRKRCNPREPEDSTGGGSTPPEQQPDPGDPSSGSDADRG
jgi:hypothetical protein